jgi:hypothetical protein
MAESETWEDTENTENVELPDFKMPVEKRFLKRLVDFGNLKDF